MYRLHPVVGRRPRARGVRPDRAPGGGQQLVLVLQRRPGQHPEHPGLRRRRALRHRLLLGQPVADAVRRRSRRGCEASIVRDPASGVDVLTSGLLEFAGGVATFTCSTRAEPDQQVHVYGTDGRISIDIPFNIPPDRPTHVHVTAGGDPPVAPATETLTFAPADPYAVEAERFAAAVLDGAPLPTPPEDAVANLRVIERLFAAGERDLTARVVATGSRYHPSRPSGRTRSDRRGASERAQRRSSMSETQNGRRTRRQPAPEAPMRALRRRRRPSRRRRSPLVSRSCSSWPGPGRPPPPARPSRTTRSGRSRGAGTRRCSTPSGGRCPTRRSTRATSSTRRPRCGTPGRPTTRRPPATS